MTKLMATALSITLMATCTRASGSMIKPMERAYTIMPMEQTTMESGKTTNSMASVSKDGQTEQSMKDSITKARRMVEES